MDLLRVFCIELGFGSRCARSIGFWSRTPAWSGRGQKHDFFKVFLGFFSVELIFDDEIWHEGGFCDFIENGDRARGVEGFARGQK